MNKKPITVRFPMELKDQLEAIATKEHWSFNQTVLEAVKKFIDQYPV